MKSFRSAFFYLLAGLLLGGYIYFFERGPVQKKDAEDKKPKIFASFVADDIREIQIEDFSNTATARTGPIRLKKDEKDQWTITSPRDLRGDDSTIRSMLTSVGDMTADTSIENPAHLSDFGLDPAQGHCVLKDKSGAAFELLIGGKNIEGGSAYVMVPGKKTVYLVPSFTADGLHKGLNDYRDHNFLKTDTVLARKVRVVHGGRAFVLEKGQDNGWELTEPVRAKADLNKVRDLLNTINGLRVDTFVTDHPAGLSTYGLAQPGVRVEVWNNDSKEPLSILIGKKKEKASGQYAKMGGEDPIYLVGEYFAKNTDVKLDDLRDKTPMQFIAASAKALTVHKGAASYRYEKDPKGAWTCPGRPDANGEASRLVDQLSGTTVIDFSDKKAATGLDHPAFIAEVTLSDGSVRTYKFGNRDGGKVFLASDRSNEVFRVADGVVAQMESDYNTILTPVPSGPATAK